MSPLEYYITVCVYLVNFPFEHVNKTDKTAVTVNVLFFPASAFENALVFISSYQNEYNCVVDIAMQSGKQHTNNQKIWI